MVAPAGRSLLNRPPKKPPEGAGWVAGMAAVVSAPPADGYGVPAPATPGSAGRCGTASLSRSRTWSPFFRGCPDLGSAGQLGLRAAAEVCGGGRSRVGGTTSRRPSLYLICCLPPLPTPLRLVPHKQR